MGLHISILWNESIINEIKTQIKKCIWIFGKNDSGTSFLISDHPVLIKSFDNKQWILGPRVYDEGMYIVFPLTPKYIMYCKEPEYWAKLRFFENSITQIKFSDDMVNHENSGQIGMSYRFIFSFVNDFDFAKKFLEEQNSFNNPHRDRF